MTDTSQVITQSWWLSKTIWATVATTVIGVANSAGYHIDPTWANSLPDILLNVAALVGSVSVMYLHQRSKQGTTVTIPVPVTVPAQETTVVSLTPVQGGPK